MPIPYDASTDALLRPELRDTVFRTTPQPTDLQLAVESARLAYYRFDEGTRELARLNEALGLGGFANATPFHAVPIVGTQAFGTWRAADNTALLAFRGTQPDKLADLGTDASVLPVSSLVVSGKVHAGFLRAYEAVHAEIVRWLAGLPQEGGRMILCGHSLGAALACLCSAAIERLPAQGRSIQLVTLGGPRTGDQEFVASLANVRWTRLVDCCDFVTRIPPDWLGYVHPRFRTYIDRSGQLRPDADDAFVAADREAGRIDYLKNFTWRLGTVPLRDLADHAPINYVRAIF
jgi:Lipase (class 3)